VRYAGFNLAACNSGRGAPLLFASRTRTHTHTRLQILASGKHVLGYVVIAHVGLLLLAEKVRVSAVLPGNHQVKTVVTSKWAKIPLQVRTAAFAITQWFCKQTAGLRLMRQAPECHMCHMRTPTPTTSHAAVCLTLVSVCTFLTASSVGCAGRRCWSAAGRPRVPHVAFAAGGVHTRCGQDNHLPH
jgi:hypothetical protein